MTTLTEPTAILREDFLRDGNVALNRLPVPPGTLHDATSVPASTTRLPFTFLSTY